MQNLGYFSHNSGRMNSPNKHIVIFYQQHNMLCIYKTTELNSMCLYS